MQAFQHRSSFKSQHAVVQQFCKSPVACSVDRNPLSAFPAILCRAKRTLSRQRLQSQLNQVGQSRLELCSLAATTTSKSSSSSAGTAQQAPSHIHHPRATIHHRAASLQPPAVTQQETACNASESLAFEQGGVSTCFTPTSCWAESLRLGQSGKAPCLLCVPAYLARQPRTGRAGHRQRKAD